MEYLVAENIRKPWVFDTTVFFKTYSVSFKNVTIITNEYLANIFTKCYLEIDCTEYLYNVHPICNFLCKKIGEEKPFVAEIKSDIRIYVKDNLWGDNTVVLLNNSNSWITQKYMHSIGSQMKYKFETFFNNNDLKEFEEYEKNSKGKEIDSSAFIEAMVKMFGIEVLRTVALIPVIRTIKLLEI